MIVRSQMEKWKFCAHLFYTKNTKFLNHLFFSKLSDLQTNLKTNNGSNTLKKELFFLQCLIVKKSSFFYYQYLCDITVVHYPNLWFAIKLKYILRNFNEKKTFILSYAISLPFNMPSLSFVYKASNWLEREVYDMFGVVFFNHQHLRKILTDYGFKGFPLLKDFPVFGYKELRYNFEHQQLTYTPIMFTQKWRHYSFIRQWSSLPE